MFKLPETLSEKEFIELLKATKHPHHKVAFMLGFYEGMRISEIVNLRMQHIDKDQKLIRIKQGKGSKDRNIPIVPEMMRYFKHIPLKCGVRALQIAFRKSVAIANIQRDLHFHNLRHSCATRLLNDKNWDITYIQQFLGHARIDTTMIYAKVSPQNLINEAWK